MTLETSTMRRVAWRLLPLILVCYFAAYLDRVNVSFAALEMNRDIGLGAAAYGVGAGLFFVSYCLCEIPSNLILARVGARRWIARIMFSWGLCAGAMAFVQGPGSFYTLRLLLGVAEAGFQPGIVFFMTLWFPAAYRARMVGCFMAAVPISGLIGAPISGALLSLHGFGLAGWQWLYILEALPPIVLSAVVLRRLTDNPREADWLQPDQRAWLTERLDGERAAAAARRHFSVLQALTSPIVLGLALVYFTDVLLNNANAFFLPQIIKAFGLTNWQTGLVTAIPSMAGLAGILWWGRQSDRHGERAMHAAAALCVGALGLAVAATAGHPLVILVALCFAVAGTYAFTPPFWAMTSSFMSGGAAAGGIAAIAAVGNFGGFIAPSIMGTLKDWTGGFGAGQLVIAGAAVAGAVLMLLLRHWFRAILVPAETGAASASRPLDGEAVALPTGS